MRPLKLIMSAFGPYKDKVEIDFEKLGSSGIFLITGDTGSGKTTIFDGISFALFGSASGSRRENSTFRSDFAMDSVPTFVNFSFMHKGNVYNIERVPKYSRKKRRGDGYTTVSGDANLTYLGEVITGEKSVTDKCIEILGMNANQFRQIVMIAQGEFMDLLFAKPKDRAEILRHIFNTNIYKDISDMLKECYLSKKREYEDARLSINSYLSGIIWKDDNSIISDNISDIIVNLEKQNADDFEYINLKEKERKKLEEKYNNFIKLISEVKLVKESINQLEDNRELLRNLTLEEEKFKDMEANVFQSKKIWDEVIPIKNQLNSVSDRYKSKLSELENSKLEFQRVLKSYNKVLKDNEKIGKYNDELLGLKEKKNSYDEIVVLFDDIISIEKEIDSKKMYIDYMYFLEKKEVVQKFKKLHSLDDELSKLKESIFHEKDVYMKKHQEYLKHYDMFLGAQAGLLAESLEDGKACPVCGSLKHPKRAVYKGTVLSREELDFEFNATEDIKKKLDNYVDRLHGVEKEHDSILHELSNYSEDDVINDIKVLSNRFDGKFIDVANISKEVLEKELSVLYASLSDKKSKVSNFDSNSINETISSISKDIFDLENKIDCIRKKYDKILKDKISFDSLIDVLGSECDSLKLEKERLEKEYFDSYSNLGYNSVNEYMDILLSKEEIVDCEKAIQDYYNKLVDVKAKIKSLEIFIKNKESVDLSELESSRDKVYLELNDINLSLKNTNSRFSSNSNIYHKIMETSDKTKVLEGQVMIYKDLSDTANGNISGQNKLEFEQFVQASYFDKVVSFANQRFSYMTDDRYELVRKDEATKLSDKLGLELEIMDYYTGKKRDIKSLSGGESFKAALSLALGMSDTIQMYSGGVVVDAMFIDEGFGSLDNESLEMAMNAIMKISEGNKMIGIISHVTELKSRIDQKIVVEKSNCGSKVNILL